MQVKIIDFSEREAWDSYVMENPNSIAWQQFSWYDVLKKNYELTFYPIVAYEKAKIRGILPLYYYKTRFKTGALISVPFAVAGGIVADTQSIMKILLDKAIELSKKHNNCKIVLKQYKHKVEGQLTTDQNYYNRELSLSADLDKLHGQFSEKNQSRIAESANYGFKVDYPAHNLNEFFKIINIYHHNKGIPCVDKKWIKSLVESGMYQMAIVRNGSKPLAATMVKEFKDTISFPFTSLLDTRELNHLSVYHLYWYLLKYYASKGKNIFHSGRIPITDDTYEFRLGWGGHKYTYYNQYYPSTVSSTEFSQKRGKKREIFEKIWKKTPRFLINRFNPFIVKQFP